MNKFRLPRKIKKKLNSTMWLYPRDDEGNSLMASPTHLQEDYIALKNGIVKEFPRSSKAESKAFNEKLDKEIFVSDDDLKKYVADILRKDLVFSSYNTLILAKNNLKAIKAYFNFVNAYHLVQKGENSYGNICCLAIDHAKKLLKKPKN